MKHKNGYSNLRSSYIWYILYLTSSSNDSKYICNQYAV